MKVGKQTYLLDNKVYIQSAYSLTIFCLIFDSTPARSYTVLH